LLFALSWALIIDVTCAITVLDVNVAPLILSISAFDIIVESSAAVWPLNSLIHALLANESKPTDDISNAYFELETTYFVKLIADENTNFYKAQYLDLVGYVKKSDVKVTADTPKTPFLKDINFRVFAPISQTMRTHPSSSLGSASQVCYIPYLSKDALYYGKIVGESAIVDRTNIWYFCRYFSDKAYYGYIYSDGCDQMPEIKKNNEIVQYIEKPNFNNSSPTASLAVVQSFDTNYVPIIALVSVPVLIFVIMLVFGKFILKSKKKEAKEIKFFFDSH